MPEDDLEALLRKLEGELGHVQDQLAATRTRSRRSTLQFGAVNAPPESEPPTVREGPTPRHTGVHRAARAGATVPQLPVTTPPEPPAPASATRATTPESKPDGRYTFVSDGPVSRRRRKA